MKDWKIFTGNGIPNDNIDHLPDPPPWRPYRLGKILKERDWLSRVEDQVQQRNRGSQFRCTPEMVDMVNAALYLRRPLLVTGKPGTGKSSLIYSVARELCLGPVMRWPVTSRSTLKEGLYEYDAIGRLQETQFSGAAPEIGEFIRLGPLGTSLLPTRRPWALLIDEIDKADVDLPSDLLNIFEEGEYFISELSRQRREDIVHVRMFNGDAHFPIERGHVQCWQFPFVVLTSNGEREFPAPFLRRCLRLDLGQPSEEMLARIVESHLGVGVVAEVDEIIKVFLRQREKKAIATDQLLNAIYMVVKCGAFADTKDKDEIVEMLFRELSML